MNNNFDPRNQNQSENPTNAPMQNQEQPFSQNQQGAYGSNSPYTGNQNPQENYYSNIPYNTYPSQNYTDESGLFNENRMARKNGLSATIGLGDWLKADCIMFLNLIPCFGSLAAIIIYLVLAFSSNTAKSLKTRYQADLIWSAIVLAIYVILIVVMIALGVSLADYSQDTASGFY